MRNAIMGSLMAASALCSIQAAAEEVNVGGGAVEPAEEGILSITVILDHLQSLNDDSKAVTKVVFSTENAEEALMSELAYFGMSDILLDSGIRASLQSAEGKDAIYVLEVPERGSHMGQTNVIIDLVKWNEAMNNPALGDGTLSGTLASFITVAIETARMKRANGRTEALVVIAD